jgi:uncharacterized protein (TIGR02594 family)
MRYCLSQWRVFLLGAGTAASIMGIGLATPAEAKRANAGHRMHHVTHRAENGSSRHVARAHKRARIGAAAVGRARSLRHAHAARGIAPVAAYEASYGETSGFERQVADRQTRPSHRWARETSSAGLDGRDSPASGGFGGGSVVSEARRWLGTNPTRRSRLWCGAFMNFVLERTGHTGTGSDLARSFAGLGHRVSGPQVGAIAVMARRGGGHVGVVSGVDSNGNPIVISGNHGRKVAETVYPRGRIYAYVMPK